MQSKFHNFILHYTQLAILCQYLKSAFRYGGFSGSAEYYFLKNAQGDVTHVYDIDGRLMGTYSYDAWGVCTVVQSPEDRQGIIRMNPFRYRGYYFDNNISLYYLNSRYYDPEIGRFISPDGVQFLEPMVSNGLNLYAYCGNNPVMNVDPNGTNWLRGLGNALRNAAQAVGSAVSTAARAVYNHVIQPVATWANDSIIQPIYLNVVRPTVDWVYENVYRPVADWVYNNVYRPAADWVGENIVDPALRWIGENILAPIDNWVYRNIAQPLSNITGVSASSIQREFNIVGLIGAISLGTGIGFLITGMIKYKKSKTLAINLFIVSGFFDTIALILLTLSGR